PRFFRKSDKSLHRVDLPSRTSVGQRKAGRIIRVEMYVRLDQLAFRTRRQRLAGAQHPRDPLPTIDTRHAALPSSAFSTDTDQPSVQGFLYCLVSSWLASLSPITSSFA